MSQPWGTGLPDGWALCRAFMDTQAEAAADVVVVYSFFACVFALDSDYSAFEQHGLAHFGSPSALEWLTTSPSGILFYSSNHS